MDPVLVLLFLLSPLLALGVLSGGCELPNSTVTKCAMGAVVQALTIYAARHKGRYPSSAEGLAATARYMPDGQVPTDAWGNAFLYRRGPAERRYLLVSFGRDGRWGGSGEDADIVWEW